MQGDLTDRVAVCAPFESVFRQKQSTQQSDDGHGNKNQVYETEGSHIG